MTPLKGIHHVTAIAADAQRNVDFYSGVLGLRLVKKTVNFDDPGSYHLYYGDRAGTPGTLVTFFIWPGATNGQRGAGEPVAVGLAIPKGSLDWWKQRLSGAGIPTLEAGPRLGAGVIEIADPDAMKVELIESAKARNTEFWPAAGIPEEHAITAIHSVSLGLRDERRSAALFTDELTFARIGSEDARSRFGIGEADGSSFVDIVRPDAPVRGRMGAGTIHHVAFRAADDETQREWLEKLTKLGLHASPVIDRKYFHSIYFREPGGVLFEIATDGPGMAVDESAEHLGEALVLPGEYESLRMSLGRTLPPIASPHLVRV
ncbi:MAG: ring-cleaving dioxygenase [Bryobacteraceae bacterium]|jgi:glyoxalase family protein